MHPFGVAAAAWVFATAPSKVPFYVAAGLLACWAVVLAAAGVTHANFPGSGARARLVMLTSFLLVAATLTMAVATSGRESEKPRAQARPSRPGGAAGSSSTLQLAADPTGRFAYDKRHAAATAGRLTVTFVNRSAVGHNVTIARGTKTLAATKTIQGTTTTLTTSLPPGAYIFFCSVDAHRQAGMQGTLTVR
jgi:plastocyanin